MQHPPDLGPAEVDAGGADLAVADQATGPDLPMADLATPALAPSPDFATPRDFAIPPDFIYPGTSPTGAANWVNLNWSLNNNFTLPGSQFTRMVQHRVRGSSSEEWRGTIPGQPAGTHADWFISIGDCTKTWYDNNVGAARLDWDDTTY